MASLNLNMTRTQRTWQAAVWSTSAEVRVASLHLPMINILARQTTLLCWISWMRMEYILHGYWPKEVQYSKRIKPEKKGKHRVTAFGWVWGFAWKDWEKPCRVHCRAFLSLSINEDLCIYEPCGNCVVRKTMGTQSKGPCKRVSFLPSSCPTLA